MESSTVKTKNDAVIFETRLRQDTRKWLNRIVLAPLWIYCAIMVVVANAFLPMIIMMGMGISMWYLLILPVISIPVWNEIVARVVARVLRSYTNHKNYHKRVRLSVFASLIALYVIGNILVSLIP